MTNIVPTADRLYSETFLYFQQLFRQTQEDVSKTQLISHFHQVVYQDMSLLGAALTGAVIAMLDHRTEIGGAGLTLAELNVEINLMPDEALGQLDEIILNQAATTGAGLCASPVVMQRVLIWERHDSRKHSLWLRALAKAAKIQRRELPVPLDDPFRREAKTQALEQLRPAISRLKRNLESKRTPTTKNDIVESWAAEVRNPDLTFLSDPHNQKLWVDFCRSDPYAFLTLSPERLYDAFVGLVTGHDPVYAGKKISSRQ